MLEPAAATVLAQVVSDAETPGDPGVVAVAPRSVAIAAVVRSKGLVVAWGEGGEGGWQHYLHIQFSVDSVPWHQSALPHAAERLVIFAEVPPRRDMPRTISMYLTRAVLALGNFCR